MDIKYTSKYVTSWKVRKKFKQLYDISKPQFNCLFFIYLNNVKGLNSNYPVIDKMLKINAYQYSANQVYDAFKYLVSSGYCNFEKIGRKHNYIVTAKGLDLLLTFERLMRDERTDRR